MSTQILSRTSSTSSISSNDTSTSYDVDNGIIACGSEFSDSAGRRTRKRFSSDQLMILEQLFHQHSHPTREQRELLAKEAGLELRSVTVWFQNKRQTERKLVALCNATNTSDPFAPSPFAPAFRSHASTPSSNMPASRSTRRRNHSGSPSCSPSSELATPKSSSRRLVRHHSHLRCPQLSAHRRPSLDHIASRIERPQILPQTPTRRRTYSSPQRPSVTALWENMPSSPLGPSPSPSRDRTYIDFGKGVRRQRTLEWACAAARVSGKTGDEENVGVEIRRAPRDAFALQEAELTIEEMVLDVGGDTEDELEAHEAVTPNSTIGRADNRWRPAEHGKMAAERKVEEVKMSTHDDEMMDAALVLCGLRRT